MSDLVENDPDADGMFLCAVQNSLWCCIEDEISRHCAIVPERLSDQFEMMVADMSNQAYLKRFASHSGVPDLPDATAYNKFVASALTAGDAI